MIEREGGSRKAHSVGTVNVWIAYRCSGYDNEENPILGSMLDIRACVSVIDMEEYFEQYRAMGAQVYIKKMVIPLYVGVTYVSRE